MRTRAVSRAAPRAEARDGVVGDIGSVRSSLPTSDPPRSCVLASSDACRSAARAGTSKTDRPRRSFGRPQASSPTALCGSTRARTISARSATHSCPATSWTSWQPRYRGQERWAHEPSRSPPRDALGACHSPPEHVPEPTLARCWNLNTHRGRSTRPAPLRRLRTHLRASGDGLGCACAATAHSGCWTGECGVHDSRA